MRKQPRGAPKTTRGGSGGPQKTHTQDVLRRRADPTRRSGVQGGCPRPCWSAGQHGEGGARGGLRASMSPPPGTAVGQVLRHAVPERTRPGVRKAQQAQGRPLPRGGATRRVTLPPSAPAVGLLRGPEMGCGAPGVQSGPLTNHFQGCLPFWSSGWRPAPPAVFPPSPTRPDPARPGRVPHLEKHRDQRPAGATQPAEAGTVSGCPERGPGKPQSEAAGHTANGWVSSTQQPRAREETAGLGEEGPRPHCWEGSGAAGSGMHLHLPVVWGLLPPDMPGTPWPVCSPALPAGHAARGQGDGRCTSAG